MSRKLTVRMLYGCRGWGCSRLAVLNLGKRSMVSALRRITFDVLLLVLDK